jgi:hypothetical protein
MAQDGILPWIQGLLPTNLPRGQGPVDPEVKVAMVKKLKNVCRKGYTAEGFVKNLMLLSPVDKVGDIHLVYDCTLLLVNDALGSYAEPQNFWEWSGSCDKCGRIVRGTQGLFCANYDCSQRNSTPCQKAWCGKCCKAHPSDHF